MGEEIPAAKLAQLLSSPYNLDLLLILSIRDSYPRELSLITGRDETDISRRLRRLEKAGLVEGYWRRLAGKNVRVYRLASRSVVFRFSQGRLEIELEGAGPVRVEAPRRPLGAPRSEGPLLGRDEILGRLSREGDPWTHLYGLPGIGKTAVACRHVSGLEAPVAWIDATPMDTARSLAWRVGMALAWAGVEDIVRGSLGQESSVMREAIIRALEDRGAVLVVDDVHTLQGNALSLLQSIGERLHRGRLLTLGRSSLRGVRGPMKIRVPPLDRESYVMLARQLLPGGELGEEAWRLGRGIPVILVRASRLAGKGVPPLEALRQASRSYYEGALSLPDPQASRLALVLASAGGPVRAGLACRAAGLRGAECQRAVLYLVSEGLADVGGETVALRMPLHNDLLALREALRSLVETALSSGRPEEKVWALETAARHCWTGLAVETVRRRLYESDMWPFCCTGRYVGAVARLLGCKRLGPWKAYLEAERLIAGLHAGLYRPNTVLEELKSLADDARFDPLLQFRALVVATSIASVLRGPREGAILFERMMQAYKRLGKRERRKMEANVYSVLTALHYNSGRYDEALLAAEKEAETYARLGDVNNYYAALVHIAEIHRLRGRPEEALQIISRIEDDIGDLASIMLLENLILIVKTNSLLALGRPREALDILEEKRLSEMYTKGLNATKAAALLMLGRRSEAAALVEQLEGDESLDPEERALIQMIKKTLAGEKPRLPRGAAPWLSIMAKLLWEAASSG